MKTTSGAFIKEEREKTSAEKCDSNVEEIRPRKKQKPDHEQPCDDVEENEQTSLPVVSQPRRRGRGRGRGRGTAKRGRGRVSKNASSKSVAVTESASKVSLSESDTVVPKEDVVSKDKELNKKAKTPLKVNKDADSSQKDMEEGTTETLLGRGRRKAAPKKAWVDDYTENLDEEAVTNNEAEKDEESFDSSWGSPRDDIKMTSAIATPPDKSKRKRGRPRKYPLRTEMQEFPPQSDTKWNCPLCEYTSAFRDEYDRHIRREHNITHWACDKCGKPFKDKYKMQRHRALLDCETTDVPWHESESGKYVYFPPKNPRNAATGVLSDWKADGKETTPLNSSVPGEDSESEDDGHSSNTGFGCQICDEDCKNFEEITEHLKKHPKVVPAICKFCGRWFTNKYKVWRHMTSSVHDDIKDTDLNKARKELSHLRINWKPHVDSKHPIERKEYPCLAEKCYKVFTSKFAYEAHQKIHGAAPGTTGNRFKCESCGECFSKRKYYQDHLLYEHGIVDGDLENFTCPVCAKPFTQKTHVFRHFDTLHTPSPQVLDEEILKDEVFKKGDGQDGKKDPRLYSCFVCQKIMAGYSTFYKHIHQHRVWLVNTLEGPSPDRELIDQIFDAMNQKRHIFEAIQEGVRIKNTVGNLPAKQPPPRTGQQAESGGSLPTIDQSALRDLVQPQNLFSFLQDVGSQLPLTSLGQQQLPHAQALDVQTGGQQQQQQPMQYQHQPVQIQNLQQDQMMGGLPQPDRIPSQGVVHHHPQPQLQPNHQHYHSSQPQPMLHQPHIPQSITQKPPENQIVLGNIHPSTGFQQLAPTTSSSRNAISNIGNEVGTITIIESPTKSTGHSPQTKGVSKNQKPIEVGQEASSENLINDPSEIEKSGPAEADTDPSKYTCPYCLGRFETLAELVNHKITEHKLVSAFCCIQKDCRQIFHKALDYQNHEHTQKAFICSICNDHFVDMTDLMAHKTSAHRLFEGRRCNVCLKTFPTKDALKAHAAEDSQHFPCKQCGKVVGSQTLLLEHEAEHLKLEIYLCDICGATFKSKPQLSKHTSTHVERAHKCDECGAQFLKREHLRRHIITRHSNDKPYVCQIAGCDKSFKRKDKLQEHYRSHSNAKPYKCDKCGKSYRYREGLRYHEVTHQKESRYFCNICSDGFVKPAELRYHMKKKHDIAMKATHSYPCQHCSTVFARPERLKRHMEKEHGISADWQYICNACNKGFAGERSLTTHVKRRHAAHSTNTELLNAQKLLKKKVIKAKGVDDIRSKSEQMLTASSLQTLDMNPRSISDQSQKMFTVLSHGDKVAMPQANLASIQSLSQGQKPTLLQQQQQQQQHGPITLSMAAPMPQPIQVQVPTIIRSVPQVSLQPQTSIAMIQPSGAPTLTTSAAPVSASPMVLAAHSSFLQQIHLANYQPNVSLQSQTIRPTTVSNPGLPQTQVVSPAVNVNNQGQIELQPISRVMMNPQPQPASIPILQAPLQQAQTSQQAQNANVGFTHLATYATFNNYDFGQTAPNQVIHQQPQVTLTPQGQSLNSRTQ